MRYEKYVHPLRFLHTLPLSHVFGQTMGLWIPPIFRAEVHFESRLVAPRLIETIHRERISVLAAVPRVFALLKTHLETELSRIGRQDRGIQGHPRMEAMVAFPGGASRVRLQVLGTHLWWGRAARRGGAILERAWLRAWCRATG